MRRPREITAAAMVALTGSFLFLIFGLLLGGYLGTTLYSLSKQYPGTDINKSADTSIPNLIHILFTVSAVFAVLGIIGAFTASALLRMRPWARRAFIGWCIGSTFACLLGLFYPGSRSEYGINPTLILVPMLVLFPVNAWWLLLFFRPEIRAQFAPPGAQLRTISLDFSRFRARGFLSLAVAGILAAAVGAWLFWFGSPMREIERTRSALAAANAWHSHTIRFDPTNLAAEPETFDKDAACPSYLRTIQSGRDSRGEPAIFDSMIFRGHAYGHRDGQWIVSGGQRADVNAEGSIPILECEQGPIGTDPTSLPIPTILENGNARKGALREVEGEWCRDYEIVVATPHDPAEREFHFTLCINEADHLPRQTRRNPPGYAQELATTYTHWRTEAAPELPADFHP